MLLIQKTLKRLIDNAIELIENDSEIYASCVNRRRKGFQDCGADISEMRELNSLGRKTVWNIRKQKFLEE